jgi:hypothetical protein
MPRLAAKINASHQPAADHRGLGHAPDVCVDRSDRSVHGNPCGDQTPYGGRKTRDPFAGFERLVDEGSPLSTRLTPTWGVVLEKTN